MTGLCTKIRLAAKRNKNPSTDYTELLINLRNLWIDSCRGRSLS